MYAQYTHGTRAKVVVERSKNVLEGSLYKEDKVTHAKTTEIERWS